MTAAPKLTLHGFFRSSCSWRVRIALAYKGVAHEQRAVDLLAGEQHRAPFVEKNPIHQVPLLEIEEGGTSWRLGQSLAILEWLEERFPTPPLLPREPRLRAKARQLAELVNSSIQPLQNLIVLSRVEALGVKRSAWARSFIEPGLVALDREASGTAGRFLVGHEVSFADLCLVPQLDAARRHGVNLSAFPRLLRIDAACAELPAFQVAHADRQPDAR